nr:restriction endonuclease [Bacillus cereus]
MKFVEVKRYIKESIGRPYIQKLHSAIIDGEATGGYFVTLSHFIELPPLSLCLEVRDS